MTTEINRVDQLSKGLVPFLQQMPLGEALGVLQEINGTGEYWDVLSGVTAELPEGIVLRKAIETERVLTLISTIEKTGLQPITGQAQEVRPFVEAQLRSILSMPMVVADGEETNIRKKDDCLIDLIIDLGFVTAGQVTESRAQANSVEMGVVEWLVESKILTEAAVTQVKAAQFGAEVVKISEQEIPEDVIATVFPELAERYRIIPVEKRGDRVIIAMTDPSDLMIMDSLTHLLNSEIEIRVAGQADIDAALQKYYGVKPKAPAAPVLSSAGLGKKNARAWVRAYLSGVVMPPAELSAK